MPTYLVKQTFETSRDGTEVSERLVDAANKSAAIRHVASATITAEVATIAEAMRLANSGVKVESAE